MNYAQCRVRCRDNIHETGAGIGRCRVKERPRGNTIRVHSVQSSFRGCIPMDAAFGAEIDILGAAIGRCRVNFVAKTRKVMLDQFLTCSIKQGPAKIRDQ